MHDKKLMYLSNDLYRYLWDTLELPFTLGSIDVGDKQRFEVDNNLSNNDTITYRLMGDGSILSNTGNTIKLGKLIKALRPTLDSTEIEVYVSRHKSNYLIDTQQVIVSDDIGKVYDISRVGGSCMSYKGEYMEVYEDLGCKIAYITRKNQDSKDILVARAILWHDIKVYSEANNEELVDTCNIMDRVFFSKEIHKLSLLEWAKENKYRDINSFGDDILVTTGSIDTGYDYVPYLDNLYYVTRGYNLCNCEDFEYIDQLRETDGSSTDHEISYNEDMVYCEDTGDRVHIDNTYWNETHDCYYEYNDDLVYISDRGAYYHVEDDNVVYCTDTGEHAWRDDCYYVEYRDEWVESTDGYVESTHDMELYKEDDCVYCIDIQEYLYDREPYYYVEDESEYYYNMPEDVYEHSDGLLYTYPEEEENVS